MNDGSLIEQVQSFSFLYDKKNSKFIDKLTRENAWKTIGFVLDQEPSACEQRWTVLRAKYTNMKRLIKSIPSSSGLSDTPKWKHFGSMGFLDPFLTTRRTTSNYKEDQASCSFNAPESTSAPLWDVMNEIVVDEVHYNTEENEENASESAVAIEVFEAPESNPKNVSSGKKIDIPRHTMATPSRKRGLTVSNQEILAKKMGDCLDVFSKRINDPDESLKPKTGPDLDFAKGLASDMEILSREEKIYFKKLMYDTLNNIITSRNK